MIRPRYQGCKPTGGGGKQSVLIAVLHLIKRYLVNTIVIHVTFPVIQHSVNSRKGRRNNCISQLANYLLPNIQTQKRRGPYVLKVCIWMTFSSYTPERKFSQSNTSYKTYVVFIPGRNLNWHQIDSKEKKREGTISGWVRLTAV